MALAEANGKDACGDSGPPKLLDTLVAAAPVELILGEDDRTLAPPTTAELVLPDETGNDAVTDDRLDTLLDAPVKRILAELLDETELVVLIDDRLDALKEIPRVGVPAELLDEAVRDGVTDDRLDALLETPLNRTNSKLLPPIDDEPLILLVTAELEPVKEADTEAGDDSVPVSIPAKVLAEVLEELLFPNGGNDDALEWLDGGGVGWAPAGNLRLRVLKFPLRSTIILS